MWIIKRRMEDTNSVLWDDDQSVIEGYDEYLSRTNKDVDAMRDP